MRDFNRNFHRFLFLLYRFDHLTKAETSELGQLYTSLHEPQQGPDHVYSGRQGEYERQEQMVYELLKKDPDVLWENLWLDSLYAKYLGRLKLCADGMPEHRSVIESLEINNGEALATSTPPGDGEWGGKRKVRAWVKGYTHEETINAVCLKLFNSFTEPETTRYVMDFDGKWQLRSPSLHTLIADEIAQGHIGHCKWCKEPIHLLDRKNATPFCCRTHQNNYIKQAKSQLCKLLDSGQQGPEVMDAIKRSYPEVQIKTIQKWYESSPYIKGKKGTK